MRCALATSIAVNVGLAWQLGEAMAEAKQAWACARGWHEHHLKTLRRIARRGNLPLPESMIKTTKFDPTSKF